MLPPDSGSIVVRRYFFDLRDDKGVIADDEGLLFSTLEAVQDEAARALGDFARDETRRADLDAGHVHQMAIEVRDERGPVMRAKFSFEIKRLQ
jgi:hypothetical protein